MAQNSTFGVGGVGGGGRPTHALHRRLGQILVEADMLVDRGPMVTRRELDRLQKRLVEAAGIVAILREAAVGQPALETPLDAARRAVLKAQARVGVALVAVTPGPRYATVAFDGLTASLPRGLADIVAILAAVAEREGDGFPGWFELDALGMRLGGGRGRVKRHAVVNRVHRLRKALLAAGLNPYFIETDRGAAAVRLRLRRPAA